MVWQYDSAELPFRTQITVTLYNIFQNNLPNNVEQVLVLILLLQLSFSVQVRTFRFRFAQWLIIHGAGINVQ